MIKPEFDPYLYYYHKELDYLREAGHHFAKKYPKIAMRLSLNEKGSQDPHVERLIESFAFISARLSKEMDDRLPIFSTNLLAILYPHLITPLPSSSTAQFQIDPVQAKLTTKSVVDAGTPLFAYAQDGLSCNFRTVYPVTLWPVEVTGAQLCSAESLNFSRKDLAAYAPKGWFLKICLQSPQVSFDELNPDSLRFYISADRMNAFKIYEALFAQADPKIFIKENNSSDDYLRYVGADCLKDVGFKKDESLTPLPSHVHSAYSVVQDYFYFPEKFLYFDINNLSYKNPTNKIDLYISISSYEKICNINIDSKTFRLGCTPIVNLFEKMTDPFLLDYQKLDYRLVPDQRREKTTEIHSIEKIYLAQEGDPQSHEMSPYFSYTHHDIEKNELGIYWLTKRVASHFQGLEGTDVFLSFVDESFNPKTPLNKTIFAKTLCTNRYLPEQIPAGAILQIEQKTPSHQIICLTKPTSPSYTPRDGETLWQLISQLSTHHLSSLQSSQALKCIKENLFLYARGQQADRVFQEISSLEQIEIKPVVRRSGKSSWQNFVEGLGISLLMDENAIPGSSPFLLGVVLKEFLKLQSPINSFVEVTLNTNQRKEMWMRWKPSSNEENLL